MRVVSLPQPAATLTVTRAPCDDPECAWYGLTWSMATGEVALWSAAAIDGDWREVGGWTTAANAYGHQLHDIGDQVVYVHSAPGNGYELGASTAFPVYEVLAI